MGIDVLPVDAAHRGSLILGTRALGTKTLGTRTLGTRTLGTRTLARRFWQDYNSPERKAAMPLSRRRFLHHSLLGATGVAAALAAPSEIFAWRDGTSREGIPVILNSNENPYGPFASVQRELAATLGMVNRYPDDQYDALWQVIGKLHGVRPEEITLGAGSTDILRMAAQAFCSRSRRLITAAPTFEALAMYAQRNGSAVTQVPLRADFSHDLDAMLAKIDSSTDLVYICNPNNPTGSITPRAEIEAFIAKVPQHAYVLVDEAYHHFAVGASGYESFADKRVDDPRVIVARTFSKIYGLAGLRVGYAVGTAETIDRLSTFSVFDTPNVLAARAATAGLSDPAALASAVKRSNADRDEFLRQAASRKLKSIPSSANFVMFETGRPIRALIEQFKQHDVLIGRPFPPYEKHARISLGTPDEMKAFWKAWDSITAA